MEVNDGQCACGAVRFRFTGDGGGASVCHCAMCRKWCGGLPLASVDGKVEITAGEESLRWWQSSPWGQRGFCGVCGSSLFWHTGGDVAWSVSAGALANEAVGTVEQHIFTDEAGGFYDFADNAPRKSGAAHVAEVFAEFREKFGEKFYADACAQLRQHNGDAFADEVDKLMQK